MSLRSRRWLLFSALVWRPLSQDAGRTLLSISAVALGIAVVIGIRTANRAALASFQQTTAAVTGGAQLVVHGPSPIPASLLSKLKWLGADAEVVPYLDRLAIDERAHDTLEVLGIDLLARGAAGASGTETVQSSGVNASPGIILTEKYARQYGYRAQGEIVLSLSGRYTVFHISGLLPNRGIGRAQQGNIALVDIDDAQRTFNAGDSRAEASFDGLQLFLAPGVAASDVIGRLRPLLPADDAIEPPSALESQSGKMLAAFAANLDALSYIALLVGAFLIYNTISMAVVTRRQELATARALGTLRRTLVAMLLAESVVIALAGGAIGLLLGWLFARASLAMISTTINSLYAVTHVGGVRLQRVDILLGLALALATGLLSALAPALEAARIAPALGIRRDTLESETSVRRQRMLVPAFLLAAAAFALSRLPPLGRAPIFGYLGALAAVLSCACFMPPLIGALLPRFRRILLRYGKPAPALASASLAGSLRRTSVLLIALSTAVGMMVGVAIMVGSFRETVRTWVNETLQGDVFVRALDWTRQRPSPLDPEVLHKVEAVPGVRGADEYYSFAFTFHGQPIFIASSWEKDVAHNRRLTSFANYEQRQQKRGEERLQLLSGEPGARVFERAHRLNQVIVSEPFARHFGLWPGDWVEFNTARGTARLRIADVYYDYSSDRGFIYLDLDQYRRYFGEPPVSNVALYAEDGVSPAELRRRVSAAAAGAAVTIHDNASLKREVFRVFDQTFRITYALELIAMVVAVLGVANTLLAVVLERDREFGILRFLGSTSPQTRRMVIAESGWIGVFSIFFGNVLGVVLALFLVYVVNVQSFGWTIQWHVPYGYLLLASALVFVATVLAGIIPARMASRLDPLTAVTAE